MITHNDDCFVVCVATTQRWWQMNACEWAAFAGGKKRREKHGDDERQHSVHKSIKGQTPPKTHTVMVQYWNENIYKFFRILINDFILCLWRSFALLQIYIHWGRAVVGGRNTSRSIPYTLHFFLHNHQHEVEHSWKSLAMITQCIMSST